MIGPADRAGFLTFTGCYPELVPWLVEQGLLSEDGDTVIRAFDLTRLSTAGPDPRTDEGVWSVALK